MMMMTTIIMMKKKSKTLVHPAATQYFVQMALLHFGYKYPIWMCELGERNVARARWGRTQTPHSSWPNIHFEIYISHWLRSKWDKPCGCALCTQCNQPHHTFSITCVGCVYVLYQYNTFFLHSISLSFSRSIEFVYANMNMSMSMNECCCYHFPTIIYINKKTCKEKMYSFCANVNADREKRNKNERKIEV